jgi:O-antigen/teichoic acid export membrane protein
MGNASQIHAALLVRNTALNIMGRVIPFLIGLATIPYIVRGLGTERFGVLAIAWVLLGYFSLFDLGLGRATTKFVADCLGRGKEQELPELIWTSLGFQVLLGLAGGVCAGAITPLLVGRILKIPMTLVGETTTAFFVLAASLPFVLASSGLRGVLEAGQRFDIVNYIQIPASTSVFLLPALALPFGFRLPGIVLLLVLSRLVTMLAYLWCCFKAFPALTRKPGFSFQSRLLRPLAVYGGWLTITNIVGPVLVYLDRFLIGSLLSMAALTYYSVPSEVVTRLLIVPSSLVATLFPAFSTIDASGDKSKLEEFFARSIKPLLLVLGPLLLLIAVFSRELLDLWLGADFAERATGVLQILALGVLINSMAFVPFSLLQATGRPDLTAKLHLLELPLYAGLAWILIGQMGIVGAALAWTARVSVDAVLLFGAAWRLRLVSLQALINNGLVKSIFGVAGLATLLGLSYMAGVSVVVRAVLTAILFPLFALGTWRFLLDHRDKSLLTSAAGKVVATFRRTG